MISRQSGGMSLRVQTSMRSSLEAHTDTSPPCQEQAPLSPMLGDRQPSTQVTMTNLQVGVGEGVGVSGAAVAAARRGGPLLLVANPAAMPASVIRTVATRQVQPSTVHACPTNRRPQLTSAPKVCRPRITRSLPVSSSTPA